MIATPVRQLKGAPLLCTAGGAPDALGAWGRTRYSTAAERGDSWMYGHCKNNRGPALGLWDCWCVAQVHTTGALGVLRLGAVNGLYNCGAGLRDETLFSQDQ